MAKVPFVGRSYNLRSRPASVQRTVNLIPVPVEPGNERTPWVFKDAPGLVEFSVAPPPSDLLYFEVLTTDASTSGNDTAYLQLDTLTWQGYYSASGYTNSTPGSTRRQLPASLGSGYIGTLMVALNLATGNGWFGRNGTWFDSGDPVTGALPHLLACPGKPVISLYYQASSSQGSALLRTIAEEFAYTPPAGFTPFGGVTSMRWQPGSMTGVGTYTLSDGNRKATISASLGAGQFAQIKAA